MLLGVRNQIAKCKTSLLAHTHAARILITAPWTHNLGRQPLRFGSNWEAGSWDHLDGIRIPVNLTFSKLICLEPPGTRKLWRPRRGHSNRVLLLCRRGSNARIFPVEQYSEHPLWAPDDQPIACIVYIAVPAENDLHNSLVQSRSPNCCFELLCLLDIGSSRDRPH